MPKSVTFQVEDQGFVYRNPSEGPQRWMTAGPRVVALPNGEVVCSCVRTRQTTTNDFVPALSRSTDGSRTWRDEGPMWPALSERWSIFASISRDAAGRMYAFGSRTPIDTPGEPFWSDATQGLKQNELIWATSDDAGRTWSAPTPIPMPIPGSAEAPGALCVTRTGRWLGPYSPYNTFDPAVQVDRGQVVVVFRDRDQNRWQSRSMIRFTEPNSSAAEAWVIELADGRLLATTWHLDQAAGSDHTNKYALSHDGGDTWTPTRSTGIFGQSTALTALPDGRALFVYNQRKHGEPGVWLAVARPTDDDFGVEANEIAWRADRPTQHGTSGDHADWGDFSFGEPSAAVLPDGRLLVVLWCLQPSSSGVAYVRLRMCE